MNGFLRVRIADETFGLSLEDVVEVLDGIVSSNVGAGRVGMRGIAHLRGRMVPVIDLGWVLRRHPTECSPSGTVVVIRHGNATAALLVDDAEEVVPEATMAEMDRGTDSWARGAAAHGGGLVPIVDCGALLARVDEVTAAS